MGDEQDGDRRKAEKADPTYRMYRKREEGFADMDCMEQVVRRA